MPIGPGTRGLRQAVFHPDRRMRSRRTWGETPDAPAPSTIRGMAMAQQLYVEPEASYADDSRGLKTWGWIILVLYGLAAYGGRPG
jgi:hypothetical protein